MHVRAPDDHSGDGMHTVEARPLGTAGSAGASAGESRGPDRTDGAAERPEMARLAEEQHQTLGNHSYDHPDFSSISYE